ncbi:hypothetical protein [Stutzerimonas kunmingensis]|uniref:hypothetical protein n=1 Tax=Stutzerimonas kunmingensis TaxID=1211807 RepID=UPI00241E8545|nr:hypothetical protein [Stutzerimonas kunmingensis]
MGAAEAVDAFIENYTSAASVYTGSANGAADDASAAVQAALVSDTRAALAKDITDAQKAVTEAQAAVAKVAGLQSAYDSDKAADAALVAAGKTADKAANAATAAEVDVEVDAAVAIGRTIASGVTTVTDTTNSVTLYTIDATGKVSLEAGITEEDYPGITALVSAEEALIAAGKAKADAQKLADQTQILLNDADLSSTAKTALAAVQAKMDVDAAPTRTEMDSAIAVLKAYVDTAEGAAADTVAFNATGYVAGTTGAAAITDVDSDGIDQDLQDAVDAYNALNDLVNKDATGYKVLADASNPMTTDVGGLETKEAALKTAQTDSAAFEKLVAAQEAAQTDEDALTALEEAAADAAKALVGCRLRSYRG